MSKSDRREFLRNITLGTGAIATGFSSQESYPGEKFPNLPAAFNMSGYAAPKMDKVRIGFIGLGMRGSDAVQRIGFIEGVEIKSICDKHRDRVEKANDALVKSGLPKAKGYDGNDGWKAMMENEELDLVYICTPWSLHTPMAVNAMQHGKNVAVEVPAAKTLEECWQLVETSEKTKKHCMMLENCCYDFFELLTLNMARNGLFGELLHVEGAYIHDLRSLNFSKEGYVDMWRLKENASRNGDLYPTHGLGPIAQCLNINRGDKMDHLVSMSTNDFQMQAMAKEKAAADSFYATYADKKYRGNMNNMLIRTDKGKSILIQHDVTSPRPYSRIHLLSGTKGMAQKWPSPARIAFGHEWIKQEEFKALEEKYTPAIVKHIGEIAKNVGGHGGMDFIMDWRLIDCLRNGLPLDQDVYDAALWSAVAPLSEASVAKKSRTVDVPDFTRGRWKTNTPHNLTLDGGGTTTVRAVNK